MPNKDKSDKNDKKKRPFATGSKPGPDYLDQYLEEKGFYRKHVARDASSLFRVVAEQVFDIQYFHERVRLDVATFMESHIKDYANEVDKNFYNYVSNLRRSRTFGTLLELRVIARMYKRNVILFEPNQNMETTSRDFIMDEEYANKEPLRVFYSHKDKHFDTIYKMNTVERLAECQAIVYEILYTDVFKLPDVKYAVERMLHDQDEQNTLPLEDDPGKYINANGEIYEFDLPENTCCVLKDPRTCHFHNQTDFEQIVNDNKDAITIINRSDDPGKLKIFKPIDGYLYKKDKSCVRQLLDENITPFPYKVAKALDPSIYRNTEFELWSENRKEQRMKWFDTNGFPLKENEGRYWNCYGDEKVGHSDLLGLQKYSFEPQIIDEETFMSLDEKGKKKYIFVNPNDNFDLSHLTGLDHFQPPREALDQIVMGVNTVYQNRNNFRGNARRNRGGYHHNNFNHYQHHNNNHNFHNHHQQQQNNMQYVGDIERDNFQYPEPQHHPDVPQQQPQQIYAQQAPPIMQEMNGGYQYVQYDQHSPPPPIYPGHLAPQYQYIPQSPYPQPMQTVPPYQGQVIPYTYAPSPIINYQQSSQVQQIPQQPEVHINSGATTRENSRDSIRENVLNLPVNWSARESADPNGNDLPLNDIPTLQYFYNVGIRYCQATNSSNVTRPLLECVASQLESLENNQNGNDQNEIRSDPPPVPVNTPVTTKPPTNIHSGNRYNNNNHHGHRRVFHNQNSAPMGVKEKYDKPRNSHNQQRKEIQFNSNVKNVHKVETNGSNGNGVPQNMQPGNNIAQQNTAPSSNVVERSTSNVQHNTSAPQQANVQISPIQQESSNANVTEQTPLQATPNMPVQQVQQQYYHQYPAQNVYQQPAQPVICYQNENGELMPLTQSIQPVYYAPQTPIYYQPPHMVDGTTQSADSGVFDITAYQYQQTAYPYIYQPTSPIYYPQTPMIAAPHLAPVYPVVNGQQAPQKVAASPSQPEPNPSTNETASAGLNEDSPKNN